FRVFQIYFVGVKPASKGGNTYNIYGNCSTSGEAPASSCTPPPPVTCEKTCEFVICESIPAGLVFNSSYPIYNSTTSCWMRLMIDDILIGSYYWSLLVQDTGGNYTVDTTGTSTDGELIYNTILKTAQRGVKVRIAQTYQDGGYPETTNLAANSNGNLEVRSLDFKQWYPGGILHTKSWAVDGKHFYVGSANFDWRALTQVKELGMAVFNCPCLAQDFTKLLDIYWDMGAPGAKIPQSWPDYYATSSYHERPTSVPQPSGSQAVYFSAAPPGFQSCGRESDIDAMVKLIDEAQERLDMAVMDYVRFMHSRWSHTNARAYAYMHSLQDISSQLQCVYSGGKCVRRGSIEVRFIQVPEMQYGNIPYSRVYHNKYFVTEKAVYVGTSNWTPDYWKYTAGIGMVIRADDSSQKSVIVDQFAKIFERDWNSDYTIPLSYFDNNGKWTNGSSTSSPL
ncbi:unnamed protein product, partial [Haemonchus placei]|uniref:PLD phosphodiesterase domain-containing protein n=1 Tax=Haemonchus placei TaxID=6290 RepID=A0A0N4W9E8_HAEPC